MADVKELNINNTTYDIKAKTVVDQNGGSLKYWTGTKAQYDAIVTKDANTLYNITDDTDVTLTLLDALFPVGAIYIGTMNICPLATLGVGTWQLVASDRVLQGAGTRGGVGTTVNESLPNITGTLGGWGNRMFFATGVGAFSLQNPNNVNMIGRTGESYSGAQQYCETTFNASRSSSTYQDDAPVQQDAYLVNIWERIS